MERVTVGVNIHIFHPRTILVLVGSAISQAPAMPASTTISARLKRVQDTVHA